MKGPVCGVENCRSSNYEEGEDGFLYCQNGHRQHGLVRGEDDEDNYTTATRTITRKKKETEDENKQTAKHFSGRLAFDLYLKCLQLILRHQLWFLVQEIGLPAELELVVRDLWALRIAQFGDRIANSHQEPESQYQSQVFNTLESEKSDTTDYEENHRRGKNRKDKKLNNVPNLQDCLALCYLGILTLRLPFTPGDIYKWVMDGKMAYRGAIKVLPLPMRDRLPPHYHAVLDPNAMLKYKRFYTTVTDLQLSFDKEHGIIWPALNVPVLLFRYIRELALPLEVYDATTRLGSLLGYEFALHHNGNNRLGTRHLPEAQLIGCLIVCLKLHYPFDDERCGPGSSEEFGAIALDWANWCRHMRTAKAGQRGDDMRYTTEELMRLTEKDIVSMEPDQMDQYLDFYAEAFLDHAEIQRTKDTDDFRRALYDMFPIGSGKYTPAQVSDTMPLQDKLEVVRAVHSSVKVVAATTSTENKNRKSRQAYRSWKSEQDLPEAAKMVYEEAASLVGLSMDMLILVVRSVEAKMEQWRRQQIRTQATTLAREDDQG